jgi:hypothetical protein
MASFDEILEHFWDTSRTYGVHPPLTRDAISDAERELGVRLPPDYLSLMRVQDGGSVSDELDGFPLDPPRRSPAGHDTDHVWISELSGLGGPGVGRVSSSYEAIAAHPARSAAASALEATAGSGA